MTDKSLKKLSSSRKKQRKNAVNEHEPERFAPCAFVLEKYLKEYSRKIRSLQAWQRIEPD
ncbi:TPA: hypothetical protein ACNTR1_001027 [Escherichia coli]|jgi:mRNA-degrading endonuclease RelE of RelBE toxin-antitoxin system|nr:hypothetical protein [Escherichia coli]KYS71923.1 hypothetical protein AML31_02655 [Escherichia coli]MDY9792023.1 hypothetical protein [Escherichia coli]MDZ7028548.1 hypothetical protein [Escherichia coli]OWB92622.1 hypothetical protein A8M79_12340 [Escherichia coli]HAH0304340.1 hypothetical protein [Escherichia coli]